MATNKINILWQKFNGIRRLNSVNSTTELGADTINNVRLSKEKSGQNRNIKTSGWFNSYITSSENVIKLFAANMSGYTYQNQLVGFTKTASKINAWIFEDDSGILDTPVKIAEFPLVTAVTDVCMIQFGDRLAMVAAFGNNTLGFVICSATAVSGWSQMGSTNWYYRIVDIVESTTGEAVEPITTICPYGSRLAINGKTTYDASGGVESIYGIWFSEAGNPLSFTADYITSATNTSAFFVETGEAVNKLVPYNGLTAFCKNRTLNISGSTQDSIQVMPLTSKGVIGNAAFIMNGQCAYIDSYSNNVFILTNNIDGTIGFDSPIGDDIQDFLTDIENVSINSLNRRVRLIKDTGQSIIYDVDAKEWTIEQFGADSQCVTFLNKEIICDKTTDIKQITMERQATSSLIPNNNGYYSYYKTNIMWLDSQTSVKSHIYPLAIILEPQTNNNFYIKFTIDRQKTYTAQVTRSGFANIATYSVDDNVPEDGSMFVSDDDDLSGRVFFAASGNDILVTIDRPPFWRYLQIEIYTTTDSMEFNIAGIEAKQTFITDEMLDY